jgi:biopolymer transport protein ExbD
MSRFKTPDVEESVGCNLIPMIDIMFLMLLFFMLGADMSQREFEEVILPTASEVKEDEKQKGEEGRSTINLHHRPKDSAFECAVFENKGLCREDSHWLMAMRGRAYNWDTIGLQLKEEAKIDGFENPEAKKPLAKRKVIIRADQLAPYGSVNRAIEKCGEAGLYKVEVGAAMPPLK